MKIWDPESVSRVSQTFEKNYRKYFLQDSNREKGSQTQRFIQRGGHRQIVGRSERQRSNMRGTNATAAPASKFLFGCSARIRQDPVHDSEEKQSSFQSMHAKESPTGKVCDFFEIFPLLITRVFE